MTTDTKPSKVLVETRGNVLIATLNDPSFFNAMTPDMGEELMGILDTAGTAALPGRCLILTGAGKAFCSGSNLSATAGKIDAANFDAGANIDRLYNPMLRRMRDCAVPIVTVVNGPAAGIGMSIALMADLIVGGQTAFFQQAFCKVGLVPDGGSSWLLPRLVGLARARELMLLGDRLPMDTALAWGLVNRVFPAETLLDEAVALAEKLANGPTKALGLIRQLHWASFDNSFEQQVGLERQLQKRAGTSPDFREGVRSFVEKRPARFTGE